MTEEARVCDYLIKVLADLDGHGIIITDFELVENRLKSYWLEDKEQAYVMAVPEAMMGY